MERLDGIMHEISLDDEYLMHTGDDGLGRKVREALEKAERSAERIRDQITGHLPDYWAALDEMGLFMKSYIPAGIACQLCSDTCRFFREIQAITSPGEAC